jgi:hypothetical protein
VPASPDIVLSQEGVAVVAGTADQMMELDLLLVIYATNYHPALVIGGGKVGQSTVQALKQKIFRFICWSATKAFALVSHALLSELKARDDRIGRRSSLMRELPFRRDSVPVMIR